MLGDGRSHFFAATYEVILFQHCHICWNPDTDRALEDAVGIYMGHIWSAADCISDRLVQTTTLAMVILESSSVDRDTNYAIRGSSSRLFFGVITSILAESRGRHAVAIPLESRPHHWALTGHISS